MLLKFGKICEIQIMIMPSRMMTPMLFEVLIFDLVADAIYSNAASGLNIAVCKSH
jgi:hypothetical protein